MVKSERSCFEKLPKERKYVGDSVLYSSDYDNIFLKNMQFIYSFLGKNIDG